MKEDYIIVLYENPYLFRNGFFQITRNYKNERSSGFYDSEVFSLEYFFVCMSSNLGIS